jgi:hypothetical protein
VVERHLAKVDVAGSSPVSRSILIDTQPVLVKMRTLERRRRENLGLKVKKKDAIRPSGLREGVY